MDAEILAVVAAAFAVIAFVYGSVGLGGGSAYVAVMALVGVDHTVAPVIALALNLVVAVGGLLHFGHGGHFRARLIVPLVLTSVPAAFLAARVPLDRTAFQLLLGLALLVAGMRMVAARWISRRFRTRQREAPVALLLVLGALLGVLAGLTGIGGGVYLAPVLILGRLAIPKETAAACAAFIICNSLAGLAGRVAVGVTMPWAVLLPLGITVFLGGQLGAWAGARRLRPATVQALFGAIVLMVSVRLLVTVYGAF
jgi:uncharacterized membrane protein YfcA